MQVPILKQYIFSMYWMASTLSTASLVGFTTPKNEPELLFTICSMITTLTFYAYGTTCSIRIDFSMLEVFHGDAIQRSMPAWMQTG